MAPREDDARFALPLGGGTPRLAPEVVDFLLACRPEWHADALCLEYPELSWFDHDQAEAAAAVCRRCIVADECGSWAVENGMRAGVWAGVLRDPPRRTRAPVVRHDASSAWVAKQRAASDATPPRVASEDRPPAPATCEWCPMPAKKGHELCKACERKMVERFAV